VSPLQLSLSPDLQQLRDEGYEVTVTDAGHLLIGHVPYVTPAGEVAFGTLVSDLDLAGDVAVKPQDHVVRFVGEKPCDKHGQPLMKIIIESNDAEIEPGLVISHTFSSKPSPDGYPDYYVKITSSVMMLAAHAQGIDPAATARTFPVIEETDDASPFNYIDTASSRAGIAAIAAKLALANVAIVGLGGTGSYILDLVAKTPVGQIHLFDGDGFLQHNAFRAPGTPTVEQLREHPRKVDYFAAMYSPMKPGIIAHPYHLDEKRADELSDMDFVFLAMDGGDAKRAIILKLEEDGTPFIDVGLGVVDSVGALTGIVRVTASTAGNRSHVWDKQRIPLQEPGPENDYDQNIQIADLNALNAALAVIKWKKLCGFYHDLEMEMFSAYAIDGNDMINEDQAS